MGALTNKPQAFNSRNWEYNSQLTNDLTEFLTPRIRVDQFNGKIYRILPTVEWISNRIRFLYLGLRNQRMTLPISNYKLFFTINLAEKVVLVEKDQLVTTSYQKAFQCLKTRFSSKKKKKVNLIYGAIYNSDTKFLNCFENENTRLLHINEINDKVIANRLIEFSSENSFVFWGVNPRMESPLLNLKIKELLSSAYSLGNFSYSYPVKILANNFSFYLAAKLGLVKKAVNIFGITSMEFAKYFSDFEKITLIPNYLYNNSLNNFSHFSPSFLSQRNSEDITINLANQLALENSELGFNVIISSHFESARAELFLPIAGFLETNVSYYDSQFSKRKVNSTKPNYGLADLLTAFKLFLGFNHSSSSSLLSNFDFTLVNKLKITNRFINNSIPNYLIRDPLGRCNPLFKKLI